jgi:hypothetical protein
VNMAVIARRVGVCTLQTVRAVDLAAIGSSKTLSGRRSCRRLRRSVRWRAQP